MEKHFFLLSFVSPWLTPPKQGMAGMAWHGMAWCGMACLSLII